MRAVTAKVRTNIWRRKQVNLSMHPESSHIRETPARGSALLLVRPPSVAASLLKRLPLLGVLENTLCPICQEPTG